MKWELRPRLWPWLLALALVALWVLRQPSPGASARATEPPPARPVAPSPARPAPVASSASLRNVFEYARPEPSDRPVARSPVVTPIRPEPSSPPPVAHVPSGPRLVGILRRGNQLRAALSIAGETSVLAVGDSLDGYTVVGVDEEVGVRLRGPGGEEITLRPPL